MTPTSSERRHLKFGRFGRRSLATASNETRARRNRRWTGYQPLADAVTQARLAALSENAGEPAEERA